MGLEYLNSVDKLHFHRESEFCGNDQYIVSNPYGQTLYYAVQERNCCSIYCEFDQELQVKDVQGNGVLHLSKSGTYVSFRRYMFISLLTQSSKPMGLIREDWACCKKKFTVKDSTGQSFLKIRQEIGDPCSCCGVSVFQIDMVDGRNVGSITGNWNSSYSSDCEIHFAANLDTTVKILILGACFFIVSVLYLIYIFDHILIE